MNDTYMQSLPVGSILIRHTGEEMRIGDGFDGEKIATCIKAGRGTRWYMGRMVALSDLESSKYKIISVADEGFGGTSYHDTKILTSINPMNTLTAFAKRMLDTKTKTLIKAGFMTNDLRLTGSGKEALDAIVADEHKDALVEAAQAVIDEEAAD